MPWQSAHPRADEVKKVYLKKKTKVRTTYKVSLTGKVCNVQSRNIQQREWSTKDRAKVKENL